jgi:SnoaL-like domain
VELTTWIETYGRAWETGDEELVITLFTDDASYRSSPFREPFLGHEAIRAYWRRGAGAQRETRVRMGRPFVDAERVAVEWWTTMIDDGKEVTLPGCLLLRFEGDGRCSDLREYWAVEPGRREPFPGWGT